VKKSFAWGLFLLFFLLSVPAAAVRVLCRCLHAGWDWGDELVDDLIHWHRRHG